MLCFLSFSSTFLFCCLFFIFFPFSIALQLFCLLLPPLVFLLSCLHLSSSFHFSHSHCCTSYFSVFLTSLSPDLSPFLPVPPPLFSVPLHHLVSSCPNLSLYLCPLPFLPFKSPFTSFSLVSPTSPVSDFFPISFPSCIF